MRQNEIKNDKIFTRDNLVEQRNFYFGVKIFEKKSKYKEYIFMSLKSPNMN